MDGDDYSDSYDGFSDDDIGLGRLAPVSADEIAARVNGPDPRPWQSIDKWLKSNGLTSDAVVSEYDDEYIRRMREALWGEATPPVVDEPGVSNLAAINPSESD